MSNEPPQPEQDDLLAWLKKLEQANTSYADKMRKTSDDFSKRMEALGEMPTLSSFPQFRAYADLGKIVRVLRSQPADLELISGLIDALSGSKADATRAAIQSTLKTA
jgi:hypothetical protein